LDAAEEKLSLGGRQFAIYLSGTSVGQQYLTRPSKSGQV
jgi:hypothetical protein